MVRDMSKDSKKVPISIDSSTIYDISHLFTIFATMISGSAILYSKINSIKSNYKIKKDFSPRENHIITISESDEKRIDDFHIDEISEYKHSKQILHFIDTIKNNFRDEDLSFMIKNFNKLKIYNFRLEDYLRTDGIRAYYSSFDNAIYLHEGKPQEYIYHELFHAASTIGKENVFCVGFANYSDSSIGYGINEGYTQFLTNRYFPSELSKFFYPYLTQIAEIVEFIVGKDDMQSMYMRGNLNSLYERLSVYSSKEDAMEFITTLDNICLNLYKKGLNSESEEILNQALYEINTFLIKFIINKTIIDMNGSNLSLNSIYAKCLPVIRSLPAKLDSVHFKCNFWNSQIALDTICDEFEDALDLNAYKKK